MKDDQLVYLDPHYCQLTVNVTKENFPLEVGSSLSPIICVCLTFIRLSGLLFLYIEVIMTCHQKCPMHLNLGYACVDITTWVADQMTNSYYLWQFLNFVYGYIVLS